MECERNIRSILRDRMGLMIADAVLVAPGTLVKSTSGKLSRSRNRDLYLRLHRERRPTHGKAEPSPDKIVTTLQDIWRALLRTPTVNSGSRLFDELGASSIEAAAAAAEILRTFTVTVPPISLIGAETIAEQAQLITSALSSSINPEIIVTLNKGGCQDCPLFLVHGVDGNPYNYLRLVRVLGKVRPIKAIVSPSLNLRNPYRDSRDMLDVYACALEKDRPRGNFLLAGWSFGGLLAFDIARRLQERGRTVSGLVLFDSDPPSPGPADPFRAHMEFEDVLFRGRSLSTVNEKDLVTRMLSRFSHYPPTFKLMSIVSRDYETQDVQKMAELILGPAAKNVIVARNDSADERFEKLISLIESIDKTLFRQTFLPGQTMRQLHRAALVFQRNLLDTFAPRKFWTFFGRTCIIGLQGNTRLNGWVTVTPDLMLYLYAFLPLGGKDAHSSIMDAPNIALFRKDLRNFLEAPSFDS